RPFQPARAVRIPDPIPPPAPWVGWVVGLVGAFAALNFIVFILLVREGQPRMDGGRYAIMDHGRLVRYIERDEYDRRHADVLRGLSGVWTFLHAVGGSYALAGLMAPLRFRREQRRERGVRVIPVRRA